MDIEKAPIESGSLYGGTFMMEREDQRDSDHAYYTQGAGYQQIRREMVEWGNEDCYEHPDRDASGDVVFCLRRECEKCWDSLLSEAGKKENRPKIVCLCGSTRFVDIYNEYRKIFTLKGYIVLSIEIVTTQTQKDDPQYSNPELKHMLDELHKRKIDLADEVFIINKGGYIGESTHSEIEYAKVHNKIITYLEPTPPEGR
jgi:hypothetical protein